MGHYSNEETSNPSKLPLIKWFIEVLVVLLFCCVVIRMCLLPWPPTYTLTNYSHSPSIIQEGINDVSIQNRAQIKPNSTTIIFSLLITNPNKGKDIIYDDTKIKVYKNNGSSLVGERTLPGFLQGDKSNVSYLVLVNINQHKMKLRGSKDKIRTLKVSLETKVRFIIFGSATKQHLLNYEAFVPIDVSGKLSFGDDGIMLERVKHQH